jgi:hypothetical protein
MIKAKHNKALKEGRGKKPPRLLALSLTILLVIETKSDAPEVTLTISSFNFRLIWVVLNLPIFKVS